MDETLRQRVRDGLGEDFNPLYVEGLLKKTMPQLLQWMEEHRQGIQNTILECQELVARQTEADMQRGNLDLGFKILLGEFQLLAFVCKELLIRNNAVDI